MKMKLARKNKNVGGNLNDASQRKISMYFRSAVKSNDISSSKSSDSKEPQATFGSTCRAGEASVSTSDASQETTSSSDHSDISPIRNCKNVSKQFSTLIISPSPECKVGRVRLLSSTKKRKLVSSPMKLDNKRLSLRLRMKSPQSKKLLFDSTLSNEVKCGLKKNVSLSSNDDVIILDDEIVILDDEMESRIEHEKVSVIKNKNETTRQNEFSEVNVNDQISVIDEIQCEQKDITQPSMDDEMIEEIVQSTVPMTQSDNKISKMDDEELISVIGDAKSFPDDKIDVNSTADLKMKLSDLSLVDESVLASFDDFSLEDIKVTNRSEMIVKEELLPEDVEKYFRINNRHIVNTITKNYDSMILRLWSIADRIERCCILKGFWLETVVKEGNIVNVLADFDDTGTATVDNFNGLIIVHPDVLISGTTVVSSVFCQRKAILSEWFRGLDGGNINMLIGNIVHELFQRCLMFVDKCGKLTEEFVQKLHSDIISTETHLLQAYRHFDKVEEGKLMLNTGSYIAQILKWINEHMEKQKYENKSANFQVTRVHDIEENIWSPKYGIKGKVDVTAEVKIHSRQNNNSSVILPIELKTGKSSFSSEHQGQVMLYSMLMAEKRTNPPGGLLLYLKDSNMKEIKNDFKCQQGLVQMRNEIASCVAQPVITHKKVLESKSSVSELQSLPNPVCSSKFCEKCPYLTTCSAYQCVTENANIHVRRSELNKVFQDGINHLHGDDLKYFSKWCTILFLESSSEDGAMKNVWCTGIEKRIAQGVTLSHLILEKNELYSAEDEMHRFKQKSGLKFDLLKLGINVSQYVIVSVEDPLELSIAAGYVMTVNEDYIDLKLNKNLLNKDEDNRAIYRIDSVSSNSSWKISLTNVARLLENTFTSQRLRELIIHRKSPTFLEKIPKSYALKGKSILRSLNKGQQAAIFKALMCNDYLLIKGMPGAGKTSTIVALIQILISVGYSVLLTSHTHSAVDNILLKLIDKDIDFLRLGSATRVRPELSKYSIDHILKSCKSVNELDAIVKSKLIVATTCLGIGHPVFSQRKDFDYCIIDEATQILQATSLGPLFNSKRFILVGDPNQLPPIMKSEPFRGGDESLFTHLSDSNAVVELSTQYRMNREIVRLANILSYGGSLHCATDHVANATLDISTDEIYDEAVTTLTNQLLSKDIEDSVLFIDTEEIVSADQQNQKSRKICEVEGIIAVFVSQLFIKAGLTQSQLGIISPFRDQVAHLLKLVKSNSMTADVEVNTIDQYQGRDKDTIVLSCVQSFIGNYFEGNILNDKRRINVAITRAKTKLIIIGRKSALNLFKPMNIILSNLSQRQHILMQRLCFNALKNIVMNL